MVIPSELLLTFPSECIVEKGSLVDGSDVEKSLFDCTMESSINGFKIIHKTSFNFSGGSIAVKLVGVENYYDSRPSSSFTGITYGNVGNTLDG